MSGFPGEMRLQYNAMLNEAVRDSDRLTVRPDAVHLLGGRPVVVYDAKYRARADRGASLSADHFQMLAYCTALRVPTAWLIYAGAGEMKLRRILNTDIDIVEFPLDLSLPPVGDPGRRRGSGRAVLGRSGAPGEDRPLELL